MMDWARYLMLVVFENFLQFYFRFLPLCVRMSYLKKKKKMPVGGETSQLSHTLKKKKKKKNRCRWSDDPVSAVGGETSQLSHAHTLKKQQKFFLNEKK